MLHSYFAVEPELEPKIVHGCSLPDCICNLGQGYVEKILPLPCRVPSPEVIQRGNWTHYLSCRWPSEGACIWNPSLGRREDVKERWFEKTDSALQATPRKKCWLPKVPLLCPHLLFSRAHIKHACAALIIWETTNGRLFHVIQCFLPWG